MPLPVDARRLPLRPFMDKPTREETPDRALVIGQNPQINTVQPEGAKSVLQDQANRNPSDAMSQKVFGK